MKWLSRFFILASVAFGLWLLMPYVAGLDVMGLFGRNRDAWKLEMVPQSSIAVGYIAEAERWLAFPVPTGVNRIRVVSTGNLWDIAAARRTRAADPMKRWHYALEFEIVDGNGRILLKRAHNYRVNFAEIQESEKKRIVTPTFYLNENLTPLAGVIFNLDLAGFPQASRLRIRSTQTDPELADVVVRAYFPEAMVSEGRVAILWQRLSPKQKVLLAKGSVYPPELLIEEERRNLIRNLWQPAGPLGVPGIDFRPREMYILRDTDGEPEAEPIAPAGVISAPGQFAVFPIPEQGGVVRFEGQPVRLPNSTGTPASNALLKGRWYGSSTFARKNFTLTWRPGQSLVKSFEGGLVEFEAPFPIALRAFMDVSGQQTEITPERLYKRLFLADLQRPVTFVIAHESNRSTPIRLECRYLLPAAAPGQAPQVLHYEFLNAGGKALKGGYLPVAAVPAPYDQVMGQPVGTRITEFTEAYFSVPPGATQLRLFNADSPGDRRAPVLVGLFSRPQGLPREIRTPEDQFAFAAKGEKVPAWFAVRPLDYERLIIENRSQLIVTQSRPPEDKPEIQAGLFDWQDFRPRGAWLARQLLTPRDPEVPLRDEALVSTFEPISAGSQRILDFLPYLGVRQLTPALIWVSSGDDPFAATVSVDGRAHHLFRGSGRYGETRLPPLPAGRHQIRVDFADLGGRRPPELFINHVQPGPNAYVTHIAARIEKEVVFDVERTSRSEETITARFFHPAGWNGRSQLRVRIDGPPPPPLTPLPGWVFAERHFDVRPDPSYAAPIFDTLGGRSDAGRPAYIPFPVDAPLGRYQIFFSVEQGPPAYLVVSRLTPGVAPQRRFLEEPESRNVLIE